MNAMTIGERQRSEQALWDGNWHLLCHRSEVPGSGHYVRFEIFDEEVVAHHDGASVVVFDNRCPHRGARIFDGAQGKQRFVCAYHSWSWAKGRMFVPAKETFGDCDVVGAQLNQYRTEWVGDFLFVSKSPERSVSEQLVGIEEIVAAISRSIGSRTDFNNYQYACNWKIAVENALDQYHVATIHAETLNRLKLLPAQDQYFGVNNVSRAGIGDERVEKRLRSLGRLFDIEFRPPGYIAVYIFPFTFLTSTFGYSYSLQQFYPSRNPDLTNFASRFYPARLAAKTSPDALQGFFDSSLTVNHQVFVEDGEICARLPTDSWSFDPPRYVSAGEDKVVHFRRSMTERCLCAAPTALGSAGSVPGGGAVFAG